MIFRIRPQLQQIINSFNGIFWLESRNEKKKWENKKTLFNEFKTGKFSL